MKVRFSWRTRRRSSINRIDSAFPQHCQGTHARSRAGASQRECLETVLVATAEIQAAESTVLQMEKEFLYKILADQDPSRKIDRKCCRTGNIYNELRLQLFGMPGRVLKSVPTCCAFEKAEISDLYL